MRGLSRSETQRFQVGEVGEVLKRSVGDPLALGQVKMFQSVGVEALKQPLDSVVGQRVALSEVERSKVWVMLRHDV